MGCHQKKPNTTLVMFLEENPANADAPRLKRRYTLRLALLVCGTLLCLQMAASLIGLARAWVINAQKDGAWDAANAGTSLDPAVVLPSDEVNRELNPTDVQPRSVDQMLKDGGYDVDVAPPPEAGSTVEHDSTIVARGSEPDTADATVIADLPPMNERAIELLRGARAAQVEGDMRRVILKLTQANELSPDHPAILFYFGVAYETLYNAEKAREYFLKVYEQRACAGKYAQLAMRHLEVGFENPSARRGEMSIGAIRDYRESNADGSQRITLHIPVMMTNAEHVDLDQLEVPVQMFERSDNAAKKVDFVHGVQPAFRWLNEQPDWRDGEEILEVIYDVPLQSEEDVATRGLLGYYGYVVKLIYKNEPMDCKSAPGALVLVEQILSMPNRAPADRDGDSFLPEFHGDGLLPPVEAVPATDVLPFIQ